MNRRFFVCLTLLFLVLTLSACAAQSAQPKAAPVATAAPAFNQLVIVHDVVQGNENIQDDKDFTLKHCQTKSRWLHNERMIWRIKVLDPQTGELMDDKTVAQVEVKLPDGKVLPTRYANHGGTKEKPMDAFWTAGWTIPEGFPSGEFRYDVRAAGKDSRSGKLIEFTVGDFGKGTGFHLILDGKIPIVPKK